MSQPAQQQNVPGTEADLDPLADHGEHSYVGSGRLTGKIALITGADSGIGKAVAIAYAREGADVAIAYLSEHDDARDTARWVEEAGRRAILLPGDLSDPATCRRIVAETTEQLGGLDILISNAAFQMYRDDITDIPDEEWDFTLATNLSAYFHLAKAAVPLLKPGSAIIATSSIQSDSPTPQLLPYAMTKAGMASMTASLAQMLGERGIRVNAVAPGPIWTPLIPSTMPAEVVESFGGDTPLGRPGQPAELAAAYVLLGSDEGSYISGAVLPVTGGKPILGA
ncbi:SDR family oxidoreductase [Microbacterium hatanonis]|jgi:NAD(P)-dependent dehydrogenase (short-subunit alcohol dehydrogenase family)|uniref:SDR family oxidoreductase n=1 Tax=Microbacterium hatanonis TaxID=404366 RepID=A0A5C8I2Y5_9MICO|nr:SDR family oxidoreductase [Microbacterium hatanonis]TXK13126.1 SDR family oxidoreductase [Microbacterium hatanonis]